MGRRLRSASEGGWAAVTSNYVFAVCNGECSERIRERVSLLPPGRLPPPACRLHAPAFHACQPAPALCPSHILIECMLAIDCMPARSVSPQQRTQMEAGRSGKGAGRVEMR